MLNGNGDSAQDFQPYLKTIPFPRILDRPVRIRLESVSPFSCRRLAWRPLIDPLGHDVEAQPLSHSS